MRRSALSCSSQRSNVTSSCWAAASGASSAAGSSPPTAAVSAAHCRHVGSSSSAVTCGHGARGTPLPSVRQGQAARQRIVALTRPAALSTRTPHPTPPQSPHLLKVALVCCQALGSQLLEDVVQHQVHPALHQLAGGRQLGQQVGEEGGPGAREVEAGDLGERHRYLHRNLLVLLLHQAQQAAAQVRLLLLRQRPAARGREGGKMGRGQVVVGDWYRTAAAPRWPAAAGARGPVKGGTTALLRGGAAAGRTPAGATASTCCSSS